LQNILIVKTSAIGDVIHTLPALAWLGRHFPAARIDWLVEEAAADVIRDHPALDRVLVSKRKRWLADLQGPARRQAFTEIVSFIKNLRSRQYDLLIDFQGLLKSSIWVLLARARRQVGFGRGMEHSEMSYLFLNERLPAVSMDLHAVDRERKLLTAIGIPCDQVGFDLPITDRHRQAVDILLQEHGIRRDERLVAINPMTTWPTKHWQSDKFARLADRLLHNGVRVVFTGGPNDRPAVRQICAMMRHKAVNLAGSTTLLELAALYDRAAMLITTDTGPMHVGAAVGTRLIALFGPTAPWRTGPYGEGHTVIRHALSCSPCLKKQCPHKTDACMAAISVDQVMDAAVAILGGK